MDICYLKEMENIYNIIKNILKELFLIDRNINKKTCGIRILHDSTEFSRKPYISDKIEIMDLYNLKMLYLYCSERLYKKAYRNRNKLTIIESIFIKNNLNPKNKNSEWINYVYERQLYENKNKYKYKYFINHSRLVKPEKVIFLFNFAKCINGILISKNSQSNNYHYFNSLHLNKNCFKDIY